MLLNERLLLPRLSPSLTLQQLPQQSRRQCPFPHAILPGVVRHCLEALE